MAAEEWDCPASYYFCFHLLGEGLRIVCSSRIFKFSFAADSVNENLNGGTDGIRTGTLMVLTSVIMSRVWAIGIFCHDLLNLLVANFADDKVDELISSCIHLCLMIVVAG